MALRPMNEVVRDALVAHMIGLLQVSASLRRRFLEMIDGSEAQLQALMRRELVGLRGDPTSAAYLKQLRRLEAAIKDLRGAAYGRAAKALERELLDLAHTEPELLRDLYAAAAPVSLAVAVPAAAALAALVREQPLQGRLLSEWTAQLAQQDVDRINAAIRIGLSQGEGMAKIVARVLGTADLRGANGATEMSRQHATTMVRTAVMGVSEMARHAFYLENAPTLVNRELFVATLDSRTTVLCAGLDGTIWAITVGPRPPLHMNCRSIRVALVTARAIGMRPMKRSTEQELLVEYTAREKLGIPPPKTRDGLPRGTKTGFDAFARGRIRELTSQVPATLTYEEFLSRQTKAFQDEVLGKTRAKLWREGRLPLGSFVDRDWSELTLHELAVREREAFLRAGLDPDDF